MKNHVISECAVNFVAGKSERRQRGDIVASACRGWLILYCSVKRVTETLLL